MQQHYLAGTLSVSGKENYKNKIGKEKKNNFSVFVFVSKILHCVPECTAFLYSSTVLLLAKSSSSLFLMAHHLNSFQALLFYIIFRFKWNPL